MAQKRPKQQENARANPGEEASLASSEETADEAEAPEDDPELDALAALAQMDMEAALAYEASAALVGSDELRKALTGFAQDHHRHVHDLSKLIEARGGETAAVPEEALNSVFTNLASAMAMLGNAEAVRALVGNEQFTNVTYMMAIDVITDPEARKVAERNFEDEQRHLKFLLDVQKRAREEQESAAGGEPQVHA